MLPSWSTPPSTGPLKARIADEIRERIAAGRIALGSRVSDKDLAEELRVSRTPVREALLQLQTERLVVMHPQRGTFVFEPEDAEVRELCELRGVLEAGAARLLAGRAAKDTAALMMVNTDEAAAALRRRDYDECERLDTAFHELLVERCGNGLLSRSYRGISDRVRALRTLLPRKRERFARAIEEHRAIARHIAAGRPQAAAELLAGHVGNVMRMLAGAGFPENP
jgi:DNA-binding GntR family transcriptional regulator